MLFNYSVLIIFNFCVLLIGASPLAKADDKKCGYESCHKISADPTIINVHFVAHTHDDVGWLKTVDQYYYGSRGSIQKASVQYIIDSVIQGLLLNPERKFIYVESAFFYKWWIEQTDDMKETVKLLVNEGRLEFVGGAWSMNDEAAAHYQSIVDQFTWGLGFLNDTFGECGRPKIGWQIDPFGHSREQANLFTKMGYDGLFFARLDLQDKAKRVEEKKMEMVWESSSLDDSELFTGALNNTWYNAPDLFCFDIICSDEPLIDDKNSPDYNIDRRVEEFSKVVEIQRARFRSNNIMLTFGGDFTWMAAPIYFKELDKLIKYTNERQDTYKINALYSTPSCYLKALHDADITWPTKSDDFFPYASDPYSYWTGYYTSRPASKRFERIGNHFLQVCKKLSSTAVTLEDHYESNLGRLRRIMGVMQHHDAITGTEKQHVAEDYHREIDAAITGCGVNTKSSLNQFMTGKEPLNSSATEWKFNFSSCMLLNISSCDVTEKSTKFMVTVYNPLAHLTNQQIRFPVDGENYDYEVRDDSVTITSELVPISQPLLELPYRESSATHDLVLQVKDVPAIGYKSLFVSRTAKAIPTERSPQLLAETTTIGSETFSVTFDTNGLLSSINIDGESRELKQNFFYYKGALNNNEIFENRSSGAYIFRPDPAEDEVAIGQEVTLIKFEGEEVDEVHQVFNNWTSQVVRVYKNERFIEFEWLVGPIDVEDGVGKEIISRFQTDIKSDGYFWTDSNGRQMLKGKRDFRETWNLQMQEPIAGNYYPITAKIAIEDEDYRLAILNDRAQGGSSMFDGTVELMVHRRLLKDDTFGVDEALNETAYEKGLVVRGKHWLIFGKNKKQSPTMHVQERILQNRFLMPNWLFFDDVSSTDYSAWKNTYVTSHSAIGAILPENIYLMTFEPWYQKTFLVRFEHLMEATEDSELSKPITFNLTEIFPGDYDFAEVTLSGNQFIEDKKRLQFKHDGAKSLDRNKELVSQKKLESPIVTINAMEMKTFIMSPSTAGLRLNVFLPLVLLAIVIRTFI